MKCKEFRYDYIDYVKGMLSPESMSKIDEHLSGCSDCRKEVEEIRNVSVTLDNFKIEEPDEKFFINFVPNFNEKLAGRKTKNYYKKAVNYALSFSTVFSVIIIVFLLVQNGHQNINPANNGLTAFSDNANQVETPKIEEIEPSVINYENYDQKNLISKIENKEKIEQKATEAFASAAINEHADLLFSRENIASYVEGLSDEEVDKVIQELKTKDILQ